MCPSLWCKSAKAIEQYRDIGDPTEVSEVLESCNIPAEWLRAHEEAVQDFISRSRCWGSRRLQAS